MRHDRRPGDLAPSQREPDRGLHRSGRGRGRRPRRRRSPSGPPGARLLRRPDAARRTASRSMTPVQEEIFGPVVVVVPFDDDDEAIAHRQQHRVRPVRLRLLRRQRPRLRAGKQLRSGNVGINTAQRNHETPFGGFKMSRHRSRRRRLRPPRLHRDADGGVARMSSATSGGGFLEGVRVIESSLLGPAAITSHLVDLGADVIKVEPPGGDYVRQMTWPIVEGDVAAPPPRQPGQEVDHPRPQDPEGDRRLRGPRARRRRGRRGDAPGLPRQARASASTSCRSSTRRSSSARSPATARPGRTATCRATASPTTPGRARSTRSSTTTGFTRIPDQTNIGINAGPVFGAIGDPRRARPSA